MRSVVIGFPVRGYLLPLLRLGLLWSRRMGLMPLGLPPMAPLAPDLGHMGPVTADRLAALAPNFGHVLPILADGRPALPSDLGHVNPVTADGFAALATDLGHVFAILADRLSTLSSRFAGLIGRKFMRPTLDVGGFSTLARDLALPLAIHRGESAPRLFSHDALLIRPFICV